MKTHRSLTLLSCLLLPLLAAAGPVTEQQALLKAQQFMQGKTFTAQKSRRLAPRQDSNTAALYVFNAQEGGYAIVSGDDRTPAILGYSQEGRLDMDVLPEHIQSWLDGYAEQIAYLQEHPTAPIARKVVTGTAIAPLLGETEWGQGTPYNDLCPVYNNEHCLTGCVATAMAQVMYYHKWPKQATKEIPGYTTHTLHLTIDNLSATDIDWNNILNHYSHYGQDDKVHKDAVASLMLMCGAAVKMDYKLDLSGAYTKDVATALKDYFDYDASVSHIYRSNYGLQRWNQLIYDELAAGRPVIYSGHSVKEGGHAFVVDGYDKDDFFHVNWGWSGTSNAYFLLSVLDPENTSEENGYCQNQEAVVSIQKNTGIIPDTPQDGDVFTELTPEGIEMTFKVISGKDKTCQVGTGVDNTTLAIDRNVTGQVSIPSQVKGFDVIAIGDYAFYYCNKLSAVNIPPTIEVIKDKAFAYCLGLENIYIPASVSSIGTEAFYSAQLKEINVDADNIVYTSIDGMLCSKSGKTLVCFPGGRTGEYSIHPNILYVNKLAFQGCHLNKLTFPETIQSVGGWLFGSNWDLQQVVWKASKADLSEKAIFRGCYALSDVELCEGITTISQECFSRTSIVNIDLPKSVQILGSRSFYSCENLKRITFSTKVTTIGSYCFQYCDSIKDIFITYNGRALFQSTLPENAFPEAVYQDATLHVPAGSADFFRTTDGWKKFQNIIEDGDPMPQEQQADGDLWGYYIGDIIKGLWSEGGISEVAMFIPGDKALIGGQITAIRVPVYANKTSIDLSEKGFAWLAESLDDEKKIRTVAMHDVIGGKYNEFVLAEPYTISEKGVYVGVTYPEYQWGLMINTINGGVGVNDSYCYRKEGSNGWWRTANDRLTLQVRVNNHQLVDLGALCKPTAYDFSYPDDNTFSIFPICNNGLKPITDIDYTIAVNGQKESRHMDLTVDAGIGQYTNAFIDLKGPLVADNNYEISITIDKVNGQENKESAKTLVQPFQNLSRCVERHSVMEEGTGTWCIHCPRGLAAMAKAKDLFGDKFIGISIHDNDPMDINDNGGISFWGFPSCYIDRYNRGDFFDPYDYVEALGQTLKVATDVVVTVSGAWDDNKTKVAINSEVEFLANGKKGHKIFYVLVADGLKHAGSSWNQANYYSGFSYYADDPYLKPYVDAANPMTNVTFNDVMIANSYSYHIYQHNPFEGYIPTAGEKKQNNYTLALPCTGELAEAIDKDQVYVVAIVLNEDGTIANAAKAKVEMGSVGPEPKPQEPYVVYNNGTLTFYCDTEKNSREGTTYNLNAHFTYPDWKDLNKTVTDVVFDASFANARPETTAYWFDDCVNLVEVRGLSYLNTEKVKGMNRMFSGCKKIVKLELSNFNTENVSSMAGMFLNCCNISCLDLSSFNTVGVQSTVQMFSACSKLEKLTLGFNYTTVEKMEISDTFRGCSSLKIVSFTGDIPTSINSKFFAGVGTADSPATLDVPAEYRDHYAAKFDGNKFFGGYFKLSGGEEPDSYITFACPVAEAICLENWDTNGDGKLSKAEAEAVTSLNGKFYNSAITSFAELQYFEGLTALEDNAFTMCKQLTTLTIPKNVARIGESVFSGCSRLTKLEVDAASPYFCVDNDVLYTKDRRELIVCLLHKSGQLTVDQRCKVIADNAFYNCSQLTAIVLPDGLETIKAGVFVGCTSLATLHIPAKVTAIGMGGFTGCTLLNSITVDAANTVFSSDNGVLYNKSTSTLMAYPNGAGRKYSVVDGTRVIDPYAFCMTQIEEIELPATVILFGRNAFTYCSGLAKVTAHAEQPVAISDDVFSESTYATATLYVPNGTKTLYQ